MGPYWISTSTNKTGAERIDCGASVHVADVVLCWLSEGSATTSRHYRVTATAGNCDVGFGCA